MRLHVGCAMWAHPPWRGRFLPAGLGAGERLRAYASWCDAVEGNTTFYATPARDTVASWARQTDPGFRMVVKLPKSVTHEGRLDEGGSGGGAAVRGFLGAVEPLGERAHALWVQLPASFGPDDLGALAAFLRRMPREHAYAVEVRHPAFFTEARAAAGLERVLAGPGAEWLTFDTETLFGKRPTSDAERAAWTGKPRLPRRAVALTGHPIVRYIGRDSTAETIEGWHAWVETAAGWLREGRSPTVFVHTPDNADALPLARRFHAAVRERLPELAPLPDPLPTGPPTLF